MSRLVFCFAREGLLPRYLGRTVRRTGSPLGAAVVCAAFVAAVPLVARLDGVDPTRMAGDLLVDATLILYVGYVITTLAVLPFLRRLGELRQRDVVVAGTAASGVVAMTIVELREDLAAGHLTRTLLVVVILLGIGWLTLLRRFAPAVADRIGLHEGPIRADVALPDEPLAWRVR